MLGINEVAESETGKYIRAYSRNMRKTWSDETLEAPLLPVKGASYPDDKDRFPDNIGNSVSGKNTSGTVKPRQAGYVGLGVFDPNHLWVSDKLSPSCINSLTA